MSHRIRADRARTERLRSGLIDAHAARSPDNPAAEPTEFEEVVINGLDLGDTQPVWPPPGHTYPRP